jgi:hypothetical protein
MADEILQRLERIEANMVTHDELVRELKSVATNINDLRTELRTKFDALHVELQTLTATIRPLAEALSRWPELFAGLADRIRRLEER